MGRPNGTAAALLPQMSVEMAPTRRTEIATVGDVVAAADVSILVKKGSTVVVVAGVVLLVLLFLVVGSL